LAAHERKLAAHRKSLHGWLVHEIVQAGNTIITEKLSYKAWQKQYGKSVGTHAPGMFMEQLKRTRASNWRHPAGSSDPFDQIVPILSWLWFLRQETALAALASLLLWYRTSAA
jgi:hypothetical protein